MDPALAAAYETCRRIHRRHDPTYYWATRRLPRRVRPAVHALYGYVRTADELVDGPRRPPDPRAALDDWERQLQQARAGDPGAHPVARALADAGARHRLPLGELDRYMRSMRIDCDPVRFRTWEQLEDYMEGSAGSVGRIMAVLLDGPREPFGRLGLAFQLTNFLRDAREDLSLDRVYLPGLLEHPRDAVAEGVARARALFDDGRAAVTGAPPSVRPGMRIAVTVYRRRLDWIAA